MIAKIISIAWVIFLLLIPVWNICVSNYNTKIKEREIKNR